MSPHHWQRQARRYPGPPMSAFHDGSPYRPRFEPPPQPKRDEQQERQDLTWAVVALVLSQLLWLAVLWVAT